MQCKDTGSPSMKSKIEYIFVKDFMNFFMMDSNILKVERNFTVDRYIRYKFRYIYIKKNNLFLFPKTHLTKNSLGFFTVISKGKGGFMCT